MKYFIVFLILFTFTSYSQPELKIVRALPHLYNVTNAPGSNVYFAAGENGAILRSADDGNTWFGTYSVLENTVTSIYFINLNVGWAVTSYGKIAKTMNSGANWDLVAEINNAPFRDVAFVNENTGYAAGANVIYKTVNGGYTWTQCFNNNAVFIQRISAPSAAYCWAVCNEGHIFKTSNGGTNWQEISSGTSGNIMAVHFLNNQTGWYTGTNVNSTRKTTNGGNSWIFVPVSYPGPWNAIRFFDTANGYLGGAKISLTSDGGENWLHYNPYSNWIMNSTYFKNMNSGVSVSGYGLITRTSNRGVNWSIEQFGHNGILKSIFFAEDIYGWALYDNSLLVQTTDRGATWNENTALLGAEATDIFFLNSLTGMACTYAGKFYKTTNSGINWTVTSDLGEFNDFERIIFISSQKGFTYRQPGILYYTLSGGSSWGVNYSFPSMITKVYFYGLNHGWVTGKQAMLYRTTNGGNSWESRSEGIIGNVNTVSVIDTNICFAGGTRLYKSSNGGNNWTFLNNDNVAGFKELYFSNANNAWGIDTTGKIIFTSNGGSNWYQYPNPYLMSYWCANYSNNNVWFGGNFGTISTNSTIVAINSESSEIPVEFILKQNFPNPFNPKTKIRFEIPEKKYINLKIYDVQGKLVAVLLSTIIHPGSYSVDWDASFLSSGVYFAVLSSEKKISTRKIILLK